MWVFHILALHKCNNYLDFYYNNYYSIILLCQGFSLLTAKAAADYSMRRLYVFYIALITSTLY